MADASALRPQVVAGHTRLVAEGSDAPTNSDDKPWHEKAHYPELHVRVFQSDAAPGQPKRFKAVCDAPFAAEDVIQLIRDYGSRAVPWAPNIAESSIAPLGDPIDGLQLCLQYCVTRAMFGVSSRDFLTVMAEVPLASGGWVRGGVGIEAHASHPPRDGVVRGLNYTSGWIVTPVAPGHSRVVYIAHSDPRGWLPHWVVATAMGGTFKTFFEGLLSTLASAASEASTRQSAPA